MLVAMSPQCLECMMLLRLRLSLQWFSDISVQLKISFEYHFVSEIMLDKGGGLLLLVF